jgi:hypothetical protein
VGVDREESMNKLLIKLLKCIDDLLLMVESATRWMRYKLQWLRWDIEDKINWREENHG